MSATIDTGSAFSLGFSDGQQNLGTKATSDGEVLTWDSATQTWRAEAAAGGGIGGSTGAVDNRVLRADGTGGSTLKNSAVAIDDSGNITGAGTIDIGNADTTLSRLSAGNVAIEGNIIYRAGGTDVPLTDGGTGASDASGARTNLGLGTAATLDIMPETYATGTKRAAAAAIYDLCTASAMPDMIASLGLVWQNTSNITVSRASDGTITWTRNSTSATEAVQSGTNPGVRIPISGFNARVVMKVSNDGAADYKVFGVWLMDAAGAKAIGINIWKTTIELWVSPSSRYGSAITITQSATVWLRLDLSGAAITAYYSTSSTEPAIDDLGTTVASQWAIIGDGVRTAWTSAPYLVLGTNNISTFGEVVTISACRVES